MFIDFVRDFIGIYRMNSWILPMRSVISALNIGILPILAMKIEWTNINGDSTDQNSGICKINQWIVGL